jgi:uncharacterized lipoprotein YddW (UPF0748 family)
LNFIAENNPSGSAGSCLIRLGFRLIKHEPADPLGLFSAMKFKPGLVSGMPDVVPQPSWNINVVEPLPPRGQVLAEWVDHNGHPTGRPAWILSSNGVWMSHVLLPGDAAVKRRMLIALIGQFIPSVWEKTALASVGAIGQVGGYKGIEPLATALAASAAEPAALAEAQSNLERARKQRRRAVELLADHRYTQAIAAADEARQNAANAFYRVQPSRAGEFRGAWIHSAYGINDWGWERTARALKENGFNALFANLLWGGLAHYPSEVLPVAERVGQRGDQLAKCAAACHHAGIQLHVWKVCFNLANAPSNFVAALRSEGRTQKSRSGEDIDWLCPSHPDNFALERDSLLEVVRKYDIAGIHFDYIRYPLSTACFCDGCRRRFEEAAQVGFVNWPADVLAGDLAARFFDWRREQITRLVEAVSEEARHLKPGIQVSAAVFGDWASCRQDVGQDWKAWIDAGYLDFVCPMDYEDDDQDFAELVREQKEWVNQRIPLYAGIGVFRMATPEQLIRQIVLSREKGANGFVLFQHDARLANEFLPALRLGATRLAPGP